MLAIVKVLPEPVIPSKTWSFFLAFKPATNFSIAWGWSPAGVYFECILNFCVLKIYIYFFKEKIVDCILEFIFNQEKITFEVNIL